MKREIASAWLLLLAAGFRVAGAQEVEPIAVSDYAAIESALNEPPDAEPIVVHFHDLWSQPENYRGRLVRISGRVERRFQQQAVGDFPALTELWLVPPEKNPLCVLVPTDQLEVEAGETIEFTGVYLRLFRYTGLDGVGRITPLIVGRGPLVSQTTPVPTERRRFDWAICIVLVLFVVMVLGLQHLRRPGRKWSRYDPPPPFKS